MSIDHPAVEEAIRNGNSMQLRWAVGELITEIELRQPLAAGQKILNPIDLPKAKAELKAAADSSMLTSLARRLATGLNSIEVAITRQSS